MQNIRDDQNFDDKEGKKIGLGLGVNKDSISALAAYVVPIWLKLTKRCIKVVNFFSENLKKRYKNYMLLRLINFL